MDLFYYHEGSPINTLSPDVSKFQKAEVREIRKTKTKTLNSIIKNTKFKDCEIDFLTIDVEGVELDVLKGLDLNFFKPKIIVVEYLDLKSKKLEIKNLNIHSVINSPIYDYITKNNYTMVNWLHSDIVFVNNSFRD